MFIGIYSLTFLAYFFFQSNMIVRGRISNKLANPPSLIITLIQVFTEVSRYYAFGSQSLLRVGPLNFLKLSS